MQSHLIHNPPPSSNHQSLLSSTLHLTPPNHIHQISPSIQRPPHLSSSCGAGGSITKQLHLKLLRSLCLCSSREVNMAAMNSSVLACNYALSAASDSNMRLMPPASLASTSAASPRLPVIRAQQAKASEPRQGATEGRRAAVLGLAAALFATAAVSSSANAGVIDDYLEKSKANKELNDKKRLATSGANFARAYTVEFGSCKFPENFTGCQDLAKQKKVPFISDDLAIECEGKDKYKCGSNVFWKW